MIQTVRAFFLLSAPIVPPLATAGGGGWRFFCPFFLLIWFFQCKRWNYRPSLRGGSLHNCSTQKPTGPVGLPPVARRARFVGAGFPRGQLCTLGRAPGARRQLPPRATAAGPCPAHLRAAAFISGARERAQSPQLARRWRVGRGGALTRAGDAQPSPRSGPGCAALTRGLCCCWVWGDAGSARQLWPMQTKPARFCKKPGRTRPALPIPPASAQPPPQFGGIWQRGRGEGRGSYPQARRIRPRRIRSKYRDRGAPPSV